MSDDRNNIINTLRQFDLEQDSARVYLFLLKKGAQTALSLSRELKIGRTKIYRLLEVLQRKGLVSEILQETGRKFEANSYENLKLLLLEKEQEVESLKKSLPKALEMLSLLAKEERAKFKVSYYSGIKGLEQVIWNTTKAKDKIRFFIGEEMAQFLNYGFMEKARQEYVMKKIHTKEICSQKQVVEWTNITKFVKDFWELRYIDPKLLKMEFELVIYNDVYVMYSFESGEIYCVEIHNERLARMQKQIFDFMWLSAKPMRVLSKGGAAEVIG